MWFNRESKKEAACDKNRTPAQASDPAPMPASNGAPVSTLPLPPMIFPKLKPMPASQEVLSANPKVWEPPLINVVAASPDPAITTTVAFLKWLQRHPQLVGRYIEGWDMGAFYADYLRLAQCNAEIPWNTMIQIFRKLTGRPKEYAYVRQQGPKKRMVVYFIPPPNTPSC